MRYSVILLLACLLLPLPLWAQEAPPASVEAEVDRTEITIGDQIHYKLSVDYANGVEVRKPEWGQGLEGFQIIDFELGEPEKVGERWKMVDIYTLSTFTPEDYTIPPLTIPITLPTGATQELTTQPISIKVKSILPEDEKEYELKDLKGPVPVYSGILTGRVMAVVAGILVLLLILFGIWRWRRHAVVGPAVVPPPRPEDEVALERLAGLRTMLEACEEGLPQETCRTFGLELSEALREYLERRYSFPALEMTSEEIRTQLPEMVARSLYAGQTQGIDVCGPVHEVLEGTDLLKFAKAVMCKTSLISFLDRTITLVESTRRAVLVPANGNEQDNDQDEARREVA